MFLVIGQGKKDVPRWKSGGAAKSDPHVSSTPIELLEISPARQINEKLKGLFESKIKERADKAAMLRLNKVILRRSFFIVSSSIRDGAKTPADLLRSAWPV